jgi:3-dehydroquinate synthase
MGGGVATDLVGFLAATYMRGVPLILIPTTLMAMVDASIGGKNGVNTPAGKNLIGSIYHPKAIISDLNTLSTLPKKEWLNGRAEILKMGLICGAPDSIEGVARAKISVVERDPSERGLRRILNFGHTVAHALEAISNYELAHGEAVAIGCLAESFLSVLLGYLPESALDEIRKRFSDFPLRLPIQYLRESFLDAMTLDKKGAGGQVRIVLIDRIGHAMEFDGAYCRPVEKIDLQQMAEWMEMRYGFLPNQSLQRERISLHSPF